MGWQLKWKHHKLWRGALQLTELPEMSLFFHFYILAVNEAQMKSPLTSLSL